MYGCERCHNSMSPCPILCSLLCSPMSNLCPFLFPHVSFYLTSYVPMSLYPILCPLCPSMSFVMFPIFPPMSPLCPDVPSYVYYIPCYVPCPLTSPPMSPSLLLCPLLCPLPMKHGRNRGHGDIGRDIRGTWGQRGHMDIGGI